MFIIWIKLFKTQKFFRSSLSLAQSKQGQIIIIFVLVELKCAKVS